MLEPIRSGICIECGKELPESRRKFCSNECGKKYHLRNQRLKTEKFRLEYKHCKICGNTIPKHSAYYCSPECARKGRNKSQKKWRDSKKPKRSTRKRFCRNCGTKIIGRNSVYCSEKCRYHWYYLTRKSKEMRSVFDQWKTNKTEVKQNEN